MKNPAEKLFPNCIDLGVERDNYDYPMASSSKSDSKGKKQPKKKTYYPSLYIDKVDGLDGIQKEGYAVVKYKLTSINKNMREDETTGSVGLEIQELCLPDSEDKPEDMKSMLDSIFDEEGASDPEETDKEEIDEEDTED